MAVVKASEEWLPKLRQDIEDLEATISSLSVRRPDGSLCLPTALHKRDLNRTLSAWRALELSNGFLNFTKGEPDEVVD